MQLAAFTGAAAAREGGGGGGGEGGGGDGGANDNSSGAATTSSSGSGSGGAVCPFDLYVREGKTAWQKVKQQPQRQGGGGGGGDSSGSGSGLHVDSSGGWDAARKRYLNAFAAGVHRGLSDFDDHLDDVGRDFTNAALLAGTELLQR